MHCRRTTLMTTSGLSFPGWRFRVLPSPRIWRRRGATTRGIGMTGELRAVGTAYDVCAVIIQFV